MEAFIYVFVFQIIYITIKFINIRHVVQDNVYSRIVITSLAATIWLLTTSLGVSEMINGNYLIIIPYVLATIIGVILENLIRKKI